MLFLCILLFFDVLFGDYGGGFAGSPLRYGTNAREFSLSGAVIADKKSNFSTFSNPALLHYAKKTHIGFSYYSMSLDRYIKSLTYIKNIPPSAGVGLSILHSGTEKIEAKNSMNQHLGFFSSQDIEGRISFGVLVNPRLAIGLNIKIFFPSIASEIQEKINIDIQNSSGIGWDMGIIYKYRSYFVMGLVYENINGYYNWKITKYEKQDSYRELLPNTIKLGINYKFIKNISIFLQEDIVSFNSEYINYRSRLGMEYRFKNKVDIRFGIKQSHGLKVLSEVKNDKNFIPAFGFGLPIKIWNKHYIQMDYSIDMGLFDEGVSHIFSFSTNLE